MPKSDRPTPWERLVHALEDTGMETIPAELVADAVSRMIEAHVADLACREECAVDHAEIYAPAGARCPSCGVGLHSPEAKQPEPPEEPAPPESEGGEAWEPTVEDFTKASERLWDVEGAPPDIEHDDALWLILRQFARDLRARLSRTPTAPPGRIDGNGRDLLRNILRNRFNLGMPMEEMANEIADALEPHIVAEAPTASERPHEPEECFYHIEPGRGGVAVSFAYHDACRRAAGLRAGQSFYEWVKERAEAPTARPDPIEALAHRAAYHRGWSDALASLESRTTAGVEIEAPTARRVSREALLRAAEAFREAEGRNPLMETAHVVGVQAALESLGIEIEGEEADPC